MATTTKTPKPTLSGFCQTANTVEAGTANSTISPDQWRAKCRLTDCHTVCPYRAAGNPPAEDVRSENGHRLHAQLSRINDQVRAERAAKRAEQAAARDANAEANPKPQRPKKRAGSGRCEYSGEPTGSLFKPGNDARLKGALLRLARAGDVPAAAELGYRDWPAKGVTPEIMAEGEALRTSTPDWFEKRIAIRMANIDAGVDPAAAVKLKRHKAVAQ